MCQGLQRAVGLKEKGIVVDFWLLSVFTFSMTQFVGPIDSSWLLFPWLSLNMEPVSGFLYLHSLPAFRKLDFLRICTFQLTSMYTLEQSHYPIASLGTFPFHSLKSLTYLFICAFSCSSWRLAPGGFYLLKWGNKPETILVTLLSCSKTSLQSEQALILNLTSF